jgi:hypothetical protein
MEEDALFLYEYIKDMDGFLCVPTERQILGTKRRLIDYIYQRFETMKLKQSDVEKTLALAKEQGVLRPRDLERQGIPRRYAYVLSRAGQLRRVGRGLYVHPDNPPTENHSLVMGPTPSMEVSRLKSRLEGSSSSTTLFISFSTEAMSRSS